MNVNLNDLVKPETRVRLVYRIDAGPMAADTSMVTGAAARINAAWGSFSQGFISQNAIAPEQGGAPGSGWLDALGGLAGDRSYFTSIDIRTDYQLPSVTWDQWVDPMRSIPLGFLGIGPSAELDHIELVQAPGEAATNASPAGQQSALDAAIATSHTNDPGTQLANQLHSFEEFLTTSLGLVVVILAIGAGLVIYLRSKRA